MATGINDVLAIFARHINFQGDEGDRRTVAEFLNRDPDAHDTFAPKDSSDDDSNEGTESQSSDNAETDGSAKSTASTTSAQTAGNTGKSQTRR